MSRFASYVQVACRCRPLKMCPFCRKWLKSDKPKAGKR
ncbi:hypothetical protein BZL30_1971 [Mycobacterium kansasii]|uniref:Uncharacterized protein n=1 Tax=Mycobacterium kansasii TaxID=1768 RepID=A0A1V3XHT9_MYCKA|nr:hypothetical protein BZL30_1971 [Mycobacterium kansasii]